MIARLDLTAIDDLTRSATSIYSPPAALICHHLSPIRRRAYWLDEITQSLADESSIAFGSDRLRAASTDLSFTVIPLGQRKSLDEQ